jgi:hypothetical protein
MFARNLVDALKEGRQRGLGREEGELFQCRAQLERDCLICAETVLYVP